MGIKHLIKEMSKTNGTVSGLVYVFLNKKKIDKGNNFSCNLTSMFKNNIKINGLHNNVTVKERSSLTHCNFYVIGNGNEIVIGENCNLNSVEFWLEGDNNKIIVGNSTVFAGRIQIAATEGRTVRIGNGCLFSENIYVRTGDSHSVYQNGIRINEAKDVEIGNRVWVCEGVTILKGSGIPNDCVIGSKSVVTKKYDKDNAVIAGNPARIVKEGINWKTER